MRSRVANFQIVRFPEKSPRLEAVFSDHDGLSYPEHIHCNGSRVGARGLVFVLVAPPQYFALRLNVVAVHDAVAAFHGNGPVAGEFVSQVSEIFWPPRCLVWVRKAKRNDENRVTGEQRRRFRESIRGTRGGSS